MKTAVVFMVAMMAVGALAMVTDEQREEARQLAGKCMQETGTSEETVKRLRSGDTSNADRSTKCFVQCFFQGAGFVDGNGAVQERELTEKLASEYGREKAEELVSRCKNAAGADACERSFALFECYLANRATLM